VSGNVENLYSAARKFFEAFFGGSFVGAIANIKTAVTKYLGDFFRFFSG
jgi:hypothetical protein